jgi:transposase
MFDHYVAVDWAMSNMAIARMTTKSNKISVIDVRSDLAEFKVYLKQFRGKIILTFEETTTSRWLWTELRGCVDEILVCDPYRNRLLSEGPKTDKIDAEKLVKLLRADLLKEVYHSNNEFLDLRKLASSYEALIKSGVILKNRRSALFRATNRDHKKERELDHPMEQFILNGIDEQISSYELERGRYLNEFSRLKKKYTEIKYLAEIPGIGSITSVLILARIIDANRFKNRNHFLSYCGLIHHDKISGGKSYGKKKPRYCRIMKSALKIAALTNLKGDNEFNERYKYLMCEKNYSARDARSSVARHVAGVVFGMLKTGTRYERSKSRSNNTIKSN